MTLFNKKFDWLFSETSSRSGIFQQCKENKNNNCRWNLHLGIVKATDISLVEVTDGGL